MITHHDRDYKATKLIQQGRASLDPPFRELAEWIGDQWGVSVLNIIYDHRDELHAPRLQIVLEFMDHVRGFRDGLNFDAHKAEAIIRRFAEIVSRQGQHDFDLDGLFVVFSAFERWAIAEANAKISDREIENLVKEIGNPDLWIIERHFVDRISFMFYTDEQAERYRRLGKQREYSLAYADVLKRHDEFGYLDANKFEIVLDSKESFTRKFSGNWMNYRR